MPLTALQRAVCETQMRLLQLQRAQSAREEAWLRMQWSKHAFEASRTINLLSASLQRMHAAREGLLLPPA